MVTFFDLLPKFKTQIVYLINDLDDMAIKILPGRGNQFYAKFKGGKEYKIIQTTNLVLETLLYAEEITEKEYLDY